MTVASRVARSSALLAWLLSASLFSFVFLELVSDSYAAESSWEGVERVVAVGDVHGDFDNFVTTLRDAELINRRRNWIGGSAHLVQVGDLPDRGPDTDKAIELMKKLERQAEEDGGRVHALIGNHEAMNILGDLRYVHPGEYAAFRTRDSRELRDRFYANHVQQRQAAEPDFVADNDYRERFDEQFPLGYVEHRWAWAADGEVGSWVRLHDAVIKIDRTLFVHAGISPGVLGMSLAEINESIRAELAGGLGEEPGLSEAEDGPLWYRGMAQNDEATELAHVDAVLTFYDVDRVVIGHTPGMGTIVPRFDGKVIVVDSGMSEYYGGYTTSLEILAGDGGVSLNTLQLGQRISINSGEGSLLGYFEQVADLLEAVPGALLQHIESLKQAP